MERRRHVTSDMYEFYNNSLDSVERGTVYDLSPQKFAKVISMANTLMVEKMITDNLVIDLPYRMGNISIVKTKQKDELQEDGTLSKTGRAIDWKATKQLWAEDPSAKEEKTLLYFTNSHTGGYICKWKWHRKAPFAKNSRFYKFYPLRKWKRLLAKVLMNPLNDYDFFEEC